MVDGKAAKCSDLLADEDEYYYVTQPAVNHHIYTQLKKQSERPPEDVLIEIVKYCPTDIAPDIDILRLCVFSTAVDYKVENKVVAGLENDVQESIERAKTRRISIEENAKGLLEERWEGWDLCKIGRDGSARLRTVLAKLCRLGISKKSAEAELKVQMALCTGKAQDISKRSRLQSRHVQAVIANNKHIPSSTKRKTPEKQPSLKPASSKKRKFDDLAADAAPNNPSSESKSGCILVTSSTSRLGSRGPTAACSPHSGQISIVPSSRPRDLKPQSPDLSTDVEQLGSGEMEVEFLEDATTESASPKGIDKTPFQHKFLEEICEGEGASKDHSTGKVNKVHETDSPSLVRIASDNNVLHRNKREKSRLQGMATEEVIDLCYASPEQARGGDGGRTSAVTELESSIMLLGSSPRVSSPSIDHAMGLSSGQASKEVGALALTSRYPKCPSEPVRANDNDEESIETKASLQCKDSGHGSWEGASDIGVMAPASGPLSTTEVRSPDSPEVLQSSQANREPTNDLQGAMGCLKPDEWLSTTAIQLILDCCHIDGARIFDPSFLSVDSGKHFSRDPCEDRIWIMPLLLRKHWTLITIDITANSVEFWNSLPVPEYEAEAREAVQGLERALNDETCNHSSRNTNLKWSFATRSCPVQTNNSDCGVYASVIAIYKLLGLILPDSIDPCLWRLVLSYLIDAESTLDRASQVSLSANLQAPLDWNDATLPDPTGSLREDITLLKESLNDSKIKSTEARDVLRVLEEFLKRRTSTYDESLPRLHDLDTITRAYSTVTDAYDTMNLTSPDEERLSATRAILAEYETERDGIQKAKESWERAFLRCEEECRIRDAQVSNQKEKIRGLLRELRECTSSLQGAID